MATTFDNNWAKVAQAMGKTMEETIKVVALELHRKITQRTPVDTGRAKAGWQITESLGGADEAAPPGILSFSRSGRAGGKIPIPPRIYIVNAVPYIIYLEDGWSKQAPLGMVRISVAEMEAKLGAIAAAQIAKAGGAVA